MIKLHWLDKLTNRLNISESELARKMNMTHSTVNDWKRRNVSVDNLKLSTLNKLSKATNLEIRELLKL